MKILIACEESQRVCIAFRKLGFEAYSCDILDCSGGHPEWHIKGDALIEAYSGKYDMMIAHPPCTFLSNAWARFLYPKWKMNPARLKLWNDAQVFFMKLLLAPIKHIAIENPIPSKVYFLPKYDQIIQPYEYWEPFQKKTCLWLRNLPPLKPTNILPKPESTKVAWNWFNKWGKDRQKNRAKTFQWIADAMASQWSSVSPSL